MNFNGPWNNNQGLQFQQPQQQTPREIITIDMVNGEQMANSYYVAPGVTAVLMDFTNCVFYIKASDTRGIPQALRTFDFNERVSQPVNENTNDGIQTQIDEIKSMLNNLMSNQQNTSQNNYSNNNRKPNKGGNQ